MYSEFFLYMYVKWECRRCICVVEARLTASTTLDCFVSVSVFSVIILLSIILNTTSIKRSKEVRLTLDI